MPDIQLKVKRTDRQRIAWTALAMTVIDRLLYGGAKGGGKTFFMVVWLFTQCWAMAAAGKLEKSDTPPHVGWFGRKNAVDFTGTTLETWKQVIPADYYEIKGASDKHPRHILIDGRIALDYGGLDKSESIQKFNSAEYVLIGIDQAEEVTKSDVAVLRASLRMVFKDSQGNVVLPRDNDGNVLMNPRDLDGNKLPEEDRVPYKNWPFKELYTANPRQCWLKNDFILAPKDNAKFVSALPTDNPHLPDSYIKTLKDAFEHRPELLAAYLEGDWSSIEGADQVIKGRWIEEAMARQATQEIHKRFLVCDTATFGDDECVILLMDNAEIEDEVIMPYCDHDQISNRLAGLSAMNGDLPIVVEAVGADTGEAVITDLKKMGKTVIRYTPQGQSNYPEKYYNQRAEAWSEAAKILNEGVFDNITNIPVVCHNMNMKTRGQLCTPTYEFRNCKIIIEAKKSIKKRLGCSPDRGDTYIIGLWAWKKLPITTKNDQAFTKKKKRRTRQSAMSV
jgi:hypothetical protein